MYGRTREELYSRVAGNLAASLVESGSAGQLLTPPAAPHASRHELVLHCGNQGEIAEPRTGQLAVRQKAFDTAYDKTSTSMSQALHEMASRIHLLATDTPFEYTKPPLTVANVEQWAAQAAAW